MTGESASLTAAAPTAPPSLVLIRLLETLNRAIGRWVAWLALGCVLTCFAVVVLRYGFGIGLIWLQEAYVWQHALLFMLGAGPAFVNGQHVRVDLLYQRQGRRRQALLDLVGCLLLLFPFLAVIGYESWGFAAMAWAIREGSGQTGGLPGVFLLKSSLLVFVGLIGLQGIATVLRSLLVLGGHAAVLDDAPHGKGDHAA